MVVEALEESLHEFVAARIGVLGVAYLLERIGEIAASAARDGYLCKHLLVLLEDGDVGVGIVALRFYRTEVPGCAAADDGYM